jgi:hypothetical protein
MATEQLTIEPEDIKQNSAQPGAYMQRSKQDPRWVLVYVFIFVMGLGSGYFIWGRSSPFASQLNAQTQDNINIEEDAVENVSAQEISLPESYILPVSYGEIGPQLLDIGAIDYDRFVQVYENAGQPLTEAQKAILRDPVDASIVIDQESAYFLLNFFWAFGLTNQNPILTDGPMMRNGADQVGRFASTGGWTIGTKSPTELYASSTLVSLTPEQQARLEQVAQNVYRPCCNNPTHFPDCNHGMAMLGVLELLASKDASEEAMFEAAKYLNAFWFPQQTYELATFMKMDQGMDFVDVNAQEAVSGKYFSGSGFKALHQWLAANNGLEQVQGGGNSCGV